MLNLKLKLMIRRYLSISSIIIDFLKVFNVLINKVLVLERFILEL